MDERVDGKVEARRRRREIQAGGAAADAAADDDVADVAEAAAAAAAAAEKSPGALAKLRKSEAKSSPLPPQSFSAMLRTSQLLQLQPLPQRHFSVKRIAKNAAAARESC